MPIRCTRSVVLASALALAACGPANTGDAGSDVAAGPDTVGDAVGDVRADVPTLGTCNGATVEDLSALGTTTGAVLTYSSDNRMTSMNITSGLLVPSNLQQPGLCNFKIGHQRLFGYTARTNSVLRVSTTNPGTDSFFDTVVVVATGMTCSRSSPTIACNDDDPNFSGDQRRISSTTVTGSPFARTGTVNAGQRVYIALGGFVPVMGARDETREMGSFTLTVEEMSPLAVGAVCDVRRVATACADSASCVSDQWPSDSGHCRALGSVAGAACDVTGACATGLACDTNQGMCTGLVATAGQACNPYMQCGTGMSCVPPVRGSTVGVCRTDGTAVGSACRANGTCDAGMQCLMGAAGSFCVFDAATGAACNFSDSACPTTETCVTATGSGTAGMCTVNATTPGTTCTMTCSTAGSTCNTMLMPPLCERTRTVGQTCGQFDMCDAGGTCYLTDLQDRVNGLCFAPGALGGPCRQAAPTCDGTAVCSNPTDPTNGRCLNPLTAAGAACTLTDECPTDSTCVQDNTTGAFSGHCQARGSVAGALCRRMDPAMPCGASLACSSWIPEEGVCQTTAAAGGNCDPRTASIHCATGEVCRSTSITTGTCAAPGAETEPNVAPATTLAAVSTPTAIQAGLSHFDVDCYRLDVPAGRGIYAAATAPSGVCGALDLILYVYTLDANGVARMIGTDNNSGTFGCPRIDNHDAGFAWARNTGTAAETMYVCVNNNATDRGPVGGYVLSLDVRN